MKPENITSLLQQSLTEGPADRREILRGQLIHGVNYLLANDFAGLIHLLYRVDVNENRLKQLLKDQPAVDAAVLIADLLIQRQEEKESNRRSFPPAAGSEEEKW